MLNRELLAIMASILWASSDFNGDYTEAVEAAKKLLNIVDENV